MVRPTLIACVITCVSALPLWAADAEGNFAVDGIGRAPCSDLIKAIKEKDGTTTASFAGWINGFLTAMNINRDDTFDLTPWQTTTLSVSKLSSFCESNPDMALVNALGRYTSSLTPNRLTKSSALLRIAVEGKAVFHYPETLARMASALSALGYSVPEGDFGDGHVFTLRAFQTDNGLAPTGLPDQATLNVLFPHG